VRCDGKLYAVSHDEDGAPHLAVVDEAHVSDVGTIADRADYVPDWTGVERVEDADDLALARRRKGRRRPG
jgi:hypothetical protein